MANQGWLGRRARRDPPLTLRTLYHDRIIYRAEPSRTAAESGASRKRAQAEGVPDSPLTGEIRSANPEQLMSMSGSRFDSDRHRA